MKHLTKLLVFAMVIAILASCGKDDPKPVSKIVGKWKVKDTATDITVPGGDLRLYLIASLGMLPEQADDYVVYLETGQAASIDVSVIEFRNDGSYETSDGVNVLAGQWELSDDEKTLTTDKGTTHESILPVKTLTDTVLAIEFELTHEIDLPNLGYKVLLTFERI